MRGLCTWPSVPMMKLITILAPSFPLASSGAGVASGSGAAVFSQVVRGSVLVMEEKRASRKVEAQTSFSCLSRALIDPSLMTADSDIPNEAMAKTSNNRSALIDLNAIRRLGDLRQTNGSEPQKSACTRGEQVKGHLLIAAKCHIIQGQAKKHRFDVRMRYATSCKKSSISCTSPQIR
jgi:hypothetical protein